MSKKDVQRQSDEVEVFRLGKDEMNLVEHPFAVLWRNTDKNAVLSSQWQTRHPVTGKMLKASWRVEGSQDWGLPTIADERLYLVLMELTRETGWTQTVHFSRYDVLKRMGWTVNDKHYQMIGEGLARLAGVYITARNAFWNPRAKNFASLIGFHILDQFEIFPEVRGRKGKNAPPPLSHFKWNDSIYQSFVSGNIRTLDLSFALSLKRPITLRLFRFLDKKANDGKRTFEIGLRDLCGDHLGMVIEGRYDADLRAGLKPAHTELIERGFLRAAAFEPMKSRTGDKVRYEFAPRAAQDNPVDDLLPLPTLATATSENDNASEQAAPPNEPPLVRRMVEAGVSSSVADELFRTVDHDQLRLQLDCLSDREPKNPAAVFVKAVREVWALPSAYVERIEAQERAQKAQVALDIDLALETRQRARQATLRARLDEETAQLDAAYERLDERNRARVDEEATQRLGIIGHLGRNEGALRAMRRNVLREMLNKAAIEP